MPDIYRTEAIRDRSDAGYWSEAGDYTEGAIAHLLAENSQLRAQVDEARQAGQEEVLAAVDQADRNRFTGEMYLQDLEEALAPFRTTPVEAGR